MAIEIKLTKTDAQQQMAYLYDRMHCNIVNLAAAKRNIGRDAAEIRELEGYEETATAEQKGKVNDLEAAALEIEIPDYDYLKDVTKTPKDKIKAK